MKKNNLSFFVFGILFIFLFTVFLFSFSFVSAGFDAGPICGNGILEEDEECDTGFNTNCPSGEGTYNGEPICNPNDCKCGTQFDASTLQENKISFNTKNSIQGCNGTCVQRTICEISPYCAQDCYNEDGTTDCATSNSYFQTETGADGFEFIKLMCGEEEEEYTPTQNCKELLNSESHREKWLCSGGGGFPVYQPLIRSDGGIYEDSYFLDSNILFDRLNKKFQCNISSGITISQDLNGNNNINVKYTLKNVKLIDYFDNVLDTVSVDEEVSLLCGNAEFKKTIEFSFEPNADTKAVRCQVEIEYEKDPLLDFFENRKYSSGFLADFDGDNYRGISRTDGKNCIIDYPYSECEDVSLEFYVDDCNDWVVNDEASKIRGFTKTCSQGFQEFLKAGNKNEYCYTDTNNDGIGDFAMCSYCINLGMREDADDIDNDCKGSCQGSSSVGCYVSGYTGDGAVDLNKNEIPGSFDKSCFGVVNEWGISDNFCQMADNNVKIDTSVCGGYNRAVKVGYSFVENELKEESASSPYCNGKKCEVTFSKLLLFKPGGVDINLLGFDELGNPITLLRDPLDFRKTNAMIGLMRFVQSPTGLDFIEYFDSNNVAVPLSSTSPQYSFLDLSNLESEGRTRDTYFGALLISQFIDSYRGEFGKKIGTSDKSLYDTFMDYWNPEVTQDTGYFEWKTFCVAKDKCADGADNDGPKNLMTQQPYASIIQKITGANIDGEILDFGENSLPILMNLRDEDDMNCKFNDGGGKAMALIYDSVLGASTDGGSPVSNKKIDSSFYKINSYSSTQYCLDEDGDGFCYNSKAFPDCIDKISDADIFDGSSIYTNLWSKPANLLGFGKIKEFITPWYVHPSFQYPSESCTFGKNLVELESWSGKYTDSGGNVHHNVGMDLNCNKNGPEGYFFSGLVFGITPFDKNVGTGMEYYYGTKSPSLYLNPDFWGYSAPIDEVCEIRPTEKQIMNYQLNKLATETVLAAYAMPIVFQGADAALSLIRSQAIADSIRISASVALMGSMLFGADDLIGSFGGTLISAAKGEITWEKAIPSLARDAVYLTFTVQVARSAFGSAKSGILVLTTKAKVGGKLKSLKKGVVSVFDRSASEVRQIRSRVFSNSANPKTVAAGCFLNETKVLLANGSYMNIEDLEVGMEVVAYDLENNMPVNASITTTFVRNETKYRIIKYE